METSLQNYSQKCRNKLRTVVDLPIHSAFSPEEGIYLLSASCRMVIGFKNVGTVSEKASIKENLTSSAHTEIQKACSGCVAEQIEPYVLMKPGIAVYSPEVIGYHAL